MGVPGLAEQGVEGRRRGAGNESLGPREHHARDQLDLEGRPLDQGREVFDGPREDLRRLIRENATRAGEAGDRVNPQAGRRGGRPFGRGAVGHGDNERGRACLGRNRQDLPQVPSLLYRRRSYQHDRPAALQRGPRVHHRHTILGCQRANGRVGW